MIKHKVNLPYAFITYKTYINFQLKQIYILVKPNIYCYIYKLSNTYIHQLLDYKSTLSSYLFPKGILKNHYLSK